VIERLLEGLSLVDGVRDKGGEALNRALAIVPGESDRLVHGETSMR
jgi:hypothetical protein